VIEIRIENPRAALQLPKKTVAEGVGIRLTAPRGNKAPIKMAPSRKLTFLSKGALHLQPGCFIDLNLCDLSALFIRGHRGDVLMVGDP
jgi:hypothetical protein